jgi:hypothetical protein
MLIDYAYHPSHFSLLERAASLDGELFMEGKPTVFLPWAILSLLWDSSSQAKPGFAMIQLLCVPSFSSHRIGKSRIVGW